MITPNTPLTRAARTARTSFAIACCLLLAPLAPAQQRSGPPPRQADASQRSDTASSPDVTRQPDVLQRLAALSPEHPAGYLTLAEEVADRATTDRDRRLAIELLVRAFELARLDPMKRPVAASALLALQQFAPSPARRAQLRGLAATYSPEAAAQPRPPEPRHAESVSYQAAVVLGAARSGEGALGNQLLRRQEVRSRLEALDPDLLRVGVAGGLTGLLRELRAWPCPECSNSGVIRRTGPARICPVCAGLPGPRLTPPQLTSWLRAELLLLRDARADWSTQVIIDNGEPLAIIQPEDVASMFLVDPRATLWKDGAWTLPPQPEPPTQEAPAPQDQPPTDASAPAQAPAPASGTTGSE